MTTMKQKFFSEFIGTAFLLMIIVGSGIMGASLSQGQEAITLLANSLATGLGLFVLIQCLGHLSGAHFNPVVSLVEFLWGRIDKTHLIVYWLAQMSGAVCGVLITHVMFNQTVFQIAQKDRNGFHLWISELVATFGLICTIALAGRKRVEFAPLAIASYIMSAYWFTSSTSFSNPAVSFARSLSNTYSGIAPINVPGFVIMQFIGGIIAYFFLKKILGNNQET